MQEEGTRILGKEIWITSPHLDLGMISMLEEEKVVSMVGQGSILGVQVLASLRGFCSALSVSVRNASK